MWVLSAVAATLELKLARNATTYVVFTESLTVAYAIDQNVNVTSATVKVVELFASNDSVLSDITSVKLPIATGLLSGEFNLLCGTIDHAGRYRLQLDFDTDVGSGSTKTAPVEAVWPPLVVSLPPTHVALDSSVRVSVTLTAGRHTSPRCRSLHADPGHFVVELVYFGRVETKNGQRVVEPRKVKEHYCYHRLTSHCHLSFREINFFLENMDDITNSDWHKTRNSLQNTEPNKSR